MSNQTILAIIIKICGISEVEMKNNMFEQEEKSRCFAIANVCAINYREALEFESCLIEIKKNSEKKK